MSRNCRIFGRARPVIVPRRGGQVITMHNRGHIASHRNLFSTEGSQNARVHQGASIAVFISKIVWLEPDLRVRKVHVPNTHYIPNPNSPNPQPKRSLNHLETL